MLLRRASSDVDVKDGDVDEEGAEEVRGCSGASGRSGDASRIALPLLTPLLLLLLPTCESCCAKMLLLTNGEESNTKVPCESVA